jgi:hypothetical protein
VQRFRRIVTARLARRIRVVAGPPGWSKINTLSLTARCDHLADEPLKNDIEIAGDIVAHMFASASGSDSDW